MELKDIVGIVIRHALTVVGGIFVSKGYLDADGAAQLATYLTGAGAIVVAAVLSYRNKKALKA